MQGVERSESAERIIAQILDDRNRCERRCGLAQREHLKYNRECANPSRGNATHAGRCGGWACCARCGYLWVHWFTDHSCPGPRKYKSKGVPSRRRRRKCALLADPRSLRRSKGNEWRTSLLQEGPIPGKRPGSPDRILVAVRQDHPASCQNREPGRAPGFALRYCPSGIEWKGSAPPCPGCPVAQGWRPGGVLPSPAP